jgi:hypothetical protein
LHQGYKKCTPEKLEKNTRRSLRVWEPRTKTKPWFPPHLAYIDGTASLTRFGRGPREFRKNQKKGKTMHGVMVSDASPRKILNMPSQGFKGGLFQKELLPGRSSLGLPSQVTMVCASSIANYRTMVPFLVEMCIFAFPTTFATSVFSVST